MTRVAVVAEDQSDADRVVSLLEASGEVEIAWISTPGAISEYAIGNIDVLVTTSSAVDSSTYLGRPPVLYLGDAPPVDREGVFENAFPVGTLRARATSAELLAAITALRRGLSVTQPKSVGFATVSSDLERDSHVEDSLTHREIEVLEYTAMGMVNKEIAWELGISENTVKFHLSSIYLKLAVNNRVSAIRAAVDKGILDI